MEKLSHTDEKGNARMVDVGDKDPMDRFARAEGFIKLQPQTIQLISENLMKKGDVLTIAEIAGIQAAKQTANLIPLCHPLLLNKIHCKATKTADGVHIIAEVKCTGKTGVEMEALTAVNVALLTVYDMCKAVDKEMVMKDISLVEKTKKAI